MRKQPKNLPSLPLTHVKTHQRKGNKNVFAFPGKIPRRENRATIKEVGARPNKNKGVK